MTFARTAAVDIHQVQTDTVLFLNDVVALEEPLEMHLVSEELYDSDEPFAITMRTPGHDMELIAGFLVAEGIISHKDQIVEFDETRAFYRDKPSASKIKVYLNKDVSFSLDHLKRHLVATSSCGVCGRVAIPNPPFAKPTHDAKFMVPPSVVFALPERLSSAQALFKHTGGIHAAALFDRKGLLKYAFEDVGRHNAMDKLVGHALLHNMLPLTEHIVMFSGRIGFELMQKALMAGVSTVVSIGAPSSMAVEMAREFDITLVGFLKADRFNVYHNTRIQV